MKAKKRPVIVNVFELGKEYPDWFANAVTKNKIITLFEEDGVKIESDSPFDDMSKYIVADIKTSKGVMRAYSGDYIIQGVKGEIYPCRADIFKETYEIVNENGLTLNELFTAQVQLDKNKNIEEDYSPTIHY